LAATSIVFAPFKVRVSPLNLLTLELAAAMVVCAGV